MAPRGCKFPAELTTAIGGEGGLLITPFRLVLVAAGPICWAYAHMYGLVGLAVPGTLCTMVGLTGPDLEVATRRIDKLAKAGRDVLPQTTMDWGVLSVCAAFALLAAGAAVTLMGRRGREVS